MPRKLTRREAIQLSLVVLAGWSASIVLQRTAPIGQDMSSNATVQAVLNDSVSPSYTPKIATLTLVIFTDYQCPACKFANPAMERAVAADGHVRVVYKDWPIFGALSERAARVAIASARQNIYPRVHHLLMSERRRLDETVLHDVIQRAGGDWNLMEKDLAERGTEIDRQLDLNRNEAFKLGLGGTPAFLAGPILVLGAIDQQEFAEAFALGRETQG